MAAIVESQLIKAKTTEKNARGVLGPLPAQAATPDREYGQLGGASLCWHQVGLKIWIPVIFQDQ